MESVLDVYAASLHLPVLVLFGLAGLACLTGILLMFVALLRERRRGRSGGLLAATCILLVASILLIILGLAVQSVLNTVLGG